MLKNLNFICQSPKLFFFHWYFTTFKNAEKYSRLYFFGCNCYVWKLGNHTLLVLVWKFSCIKTVFFLLWYSIFFSAIRSAFHTSCGEVLTICIISFVCIQNTFFFFLLILTTFNLKIQKMLVDYHMDWFMAFMVILLSIRIPDYIYIIHKYSHRN